MPTPMAHKNIIYEILSQLYSDSEHIATVFPLAWSVSSTLSSRWAIKCRSTKNIVFIHQVGSKYSHAISFTREEIAGVTEKISGIGPR